MDDLAPLLTTYAYNVLGSFEDAKDVVQEALLKFSLIDQQKVNDRRAYLIRTVINMSINEKKKQQRLRLGYPGEWLPEPVDTERADDAINSKDVLSYSMMVLLEKLDARQRAVFILKEAFDYGHDEIGKLLDISVQNSRSILKRARNKLAGDNNEEKAAQKSTDMEKPHRAYLKQLERYINAIQQGNTDVLEQLLQDDITVIADGGGKVVSIRRPVTGRRFALAFLLGLQKKFFHRLHVELRWMNHEPALCYYHEGLLSTCEILTFNKGHIDNIFLVRNPDKLQLLRERSQAGITGAR